jgi:hypothetical protein
MILCPHCQFGMEDAADLSGQLVACPRCGNHFSMPVYHTPVAISLPTRRSRRAPRDRTPGLIAAVLSLFVPGLGQLCTGRPGTGLLFFLSVAFLAALGVILFPLWLVGLLIWLWAVVDAANG